MNEKLEKLNQEIAKTEAKLRRAEHKEKMLESHLPHPESVTDVQVSTLLKILFHRSDIRQLMEKILKINEEDAE